jgi:hypothetical protein
MNSGTYFNGNIFTDALSKETVSPADKQLTVALDIKIYLPL